MAKKLVSQDGQVLTVPADVQNDPNKFAKWCKAKANDIYHRGLRDPVVGAGGHRTFRLPGGRPLIARPEDAVDRLQDALAEMFANMRPGAVKARISA